MTEQQQGLYVSKFYEMDPEFDDIVWGHDLRDGMIVLLEEQILRADPDRISSDVLGGKYELARVRECNRWCTVTQLRQDGDLNRFIGVYGDGTKMVRSYNKHYAWIVKRDSVTA